MKHFNYTIHKTDIYKTNKSTTIKDLNLDRLKDHLVIDILNINDGGFNLLMKDTNYIKSFTITDKTVSNLNNFIVGKFNGRIDFLNNILKTISEPTYQPDLLDKNESNSYTFKMPYNLLDSDIMELTIVIDSI